MMELWIRSQDRTKLRRVIDLGIFEEQEGYTIYCDDIIDSILGTYSTQKRAFEVLDDIQSLIDFMINREMNRYDAEEYMQICYEELEKIKENGLIYQMPKD